ncbi:alcohol dehydrogenase protein [Cylindrobasidium torrendii FP15055 ss-10]|uniref:Alcohol dehydrogenase protein n=1 Tax=Cylindrobasidium torrendii FP15055 ss-10 TaxID=1314674 RepID=A0A0D7BQ51_9AGAR|nr:alcohol dehydrogenase protein [Cylindrobasidium torrendii FP15055 ss-10]
MSPELHSGEPEQRAIILVISPSVCDPGRTFANMISNNDERRDPHDLQSIHNPACGPDKLFLQDVPVHAPGPDEVLVKIRAVSLNYRDIHFLNGISPTKRENEPHLIPVSDMAGEIVALGSGVSSWHIGARVIATFNPNWQAGDIPSEADISWVLGGDFGGCLVQYRLYKTNALVEIPASLSFEEASTLPIAGMTVHEILFGGARKLQAGDYVVWPGTGGVSLLGAQITLGAGATPIVTSSSDEKLELARKLGVEYTVNYKKNPDWYKEVLDITKGKGAEHVVDCTGMTGIHNSIKAARVGGQVHILGLLGDQQNPEQATLAAQIMFRKLTVRGIIIGPKTQCEATVRVVETTKVKPFVSKVYPFEEAKDALKFLEGHGHVGKIVITVCKD